MTTVTITPEKLDTGKSIWRAIIGDKQSIGETAGEALDALTSQLNESENSSVVIVKRWQPDRFFTAAQQQRLNELMTTWRAARDDGNSLPPEEQTELENLVNAELLAAAERAKQALLDQNK